MVSPYSLWAALLALAIAPNAQASSSTPPEPAPAPPSTATRIDLGRHFFASRDAERASRGALYARLDELRGLEGHLHRSGLRLLRALELRDRITAGFAKHEAYLHLVHAADTRDEQAREEELRLDADLERRTAFIEAEVLRIPPARLRRFLAETPGLERFRFAIDKILRAREHTLGLGEEELLKALSPELTAWPAALYDGLRAETSFEPVTVDGRTYDPQRDRRTLARSPDAGIRREAFLKRYAGLERAAPLYAFALSRLAAVNNRLAILHHFDDAPEQAYWRSFLSRRDVDRLLSAVASHADLRKAHERARAQHLARALGMEQAGPWDLKAISITPEPRFTYDEMRAILARALAPLGEEYVGALNALLDPANGRVDVASGPHRRRTGFSQGFPGFPSVFFSGDFTGSYDDMRVIAHEGGHAVHRELMTKAGVLPAYAEGPHFLFESFAVLNELLLADQLGAEARSSELAAWYLEQYVEGKGTVAFLAGAEAELEQRIHEEAKSGRTVDAAFLDQLTKSVYARYSIYGDSVPELRHEWMNVTLMHEDPFYDLNYVYAGVLGLTYHERLERDPAGFGRAYVALLEHGFDAPPRELLKKYLDIDLDDPALVDGAMRVLAARAQKLKSLYDEQDHRRVDGP